ncbi:hypothetical protein BVC80_3g18 [Macleaya cordata]|uniref:Uncharacterized protein n=1 Tax=Macleaya cordata TaxID=56857 RepID=A0A200QXN1_MACCD|nr:hypothetical protein BVC80_3g18 [Macleaya cordata]
MSASLAYFDTYRRDMLSANLVQDIKEIILELTPMRGLIYRVPFIPSGSRLLSNPKYKPRFLIFYLINICH